MPSSVLIKGRGLAACCCASLLSRAGLKVFVAEPDRSGSPVLMLSEQTRSLLSDVFDCPDMLRDAVPVTTRVVSWGGPAVSLPHSGLVISEELLLARLWPRVPVEPGLPYEPNHWTIRCSRSSAVAETQHQFGRRTASVHEIELSSDSAQRSCWVEAMEGGWLFVIPTGNSAGSLIAVGEATEALLASSSLVARQIARLGDAKGSFPAHPRITWPLCAENWIACGTAAVAFDPIAGEGAGHAIRQGILASAVVRAAIAGTDKHDLFTHYSTRILSGFHRHLQESSPFYNLAGHSWWSAESEAIRNGLSWTSEKLAPSQPLFRLVDFELEPIMVQSR